MILYVVSISLQVLPDASTSGRTLLHVPLLPEAGKRQPRTAGQSSDAKDQGPLATLTVTSVHPLHLEVLRGRKSRGRIHITEVVDPGNDLPQAGVLAGYKEGDKVSQRASVDWETPRDIFCPLWTLV